MELFTYYRSTSSYRVRIALALKGLDYQAVPVNLLVPAGGEHRQPAYLAINPQGRVPALRTDEGCVLTQSPAIIEYLEERYPQVALLSADLATRAHERGVAALVACDIHPLHNVSVLNRLRQLGQDRASTIKDYLVDKGQLEDDRVYFIDAQLGQAEKDGRVITPMHLDAE